VTISLLLTDRHLNVVGDPIVCWTTVDCTLRWNEPCSGQFTSPGYPWIREQLAPGNRVMIIRDGVFLMGGPIETWTYARSDDGENAGDGVLTVTFADDLAWIAGRLTYPNPALTPEQQTTDTWTYTGNAEVGMRSLVNTNAGPAALPARQIPGLALGAVAGVGGNATLTSGWQPLTDVLRTAATTGGGLGFHTRQAGNQILFEVYQPPDKTGEVRFGFGLGNLRYLGYEVSAPTATAAIVGGQGDGADRYVLQRLNTAGATDWGRTETLVSRPGSDPVADLQTAGDEALADAAETGRLSSYVADTDDQKFGVHYNVGTKVSLEVWPGFEVADLVTLVHLQAWPTAGEVVTTTIGTQTASADPAWVQQLRRIDRRVGRLERTVQST
jgi:hypothetical protein